jgi:hypothetical protein
VIGNHCYVAIDSLDEQRGALAPLYSSHNRTKMHSAARPARFGQRRGLNTKRSLAEKEEDGRRAVSLMSFPCHLAYSTARSSRMTVTLIWPG